MSVFKLTRLHANYNEAEKKMIKNIELKQLEVVAQEWPPTEIPNTEREMVGKMTVNKVVMDVRKMYGVEPKDMREQKSKFWEEYDVIVRKERPKNLNANQMPDTLQNPEPKAKSEASSKSVGPESLFQPANELTPAMPNTEVQPATKSKTSAKPGSEVQPDTKSKTSAMPGSEVQTANKSKTSANPSSEVSFMSAGPQSLFQPANKST